MSPRGYLFLGICGVILVGIYGCIPDETIPLPDLPQAEMAGNPYDTGWWRGMDREQFGRVAYLTYCTVEPHNCIPFENYHVESFVNNRLGGTNIGTYVTLRADNPLSDISCALHNIDAPNDESNTELVCSGQTATSELSQVSKPYPVILPDGTGPP